MAVKRRIMVHDREVPDVCPMETGKDSEGIAVDLVLDSGAFSAKTQGAEIDLDEYIDYIKKNEEDVFAYAALDVIGDAEASYENLKYMESKGLAPWPVFHKGEPVKYLEEYLETYDYIALGGMVGELGGLMDWLDNIWWKYLTDDKGFPTTKVHGFGLSSIPLLLRYPWESADSTTWVLTGSYGVVLVPQHNGKEFDFLKIPNRVLISSRDEGKTQDAKHFDNFPKAVQTRVEEYLKSCGETIRSLKVDYTRRDAVNIQYFLNVEKALNSHPRHFIPRSKGIFR